MAIGRQEDKGVNVTIGHTDGSSSVINVHADQIVNNEHGQPAAVVNIPTEKGDVLESVQPISVDAPKGK